MPSSPASKRREPSRPDAVASPRRGGLKLILGGIALLVVIALAAVLIVVLGGKTMSVESFDRWVRSGSVAGVANSLTVEPTTVEIDPAEQRRLYADAASCGEYWSFAKSNLRRQAEAVPDDPGSALVEGITTELWSDASAAERAQQLWTTCLSDFQKASGTTSYPLSKVSAGTTDGVAWAYSQSLDLVSPVHLLTLRYRNVLGTFLLPEAPAPDWRDQLARNFRAELDAAP